MRRARLISLVFLVMPGAALCAQWQVTGEAGMSRLKQAGLAEANALTLGASLERATETAVLRSSVLGAQTSDSRQTGQCLTIGSVVTPAWNSAQLQLTGAVSAFGQTTLKPTSSADGLVE